VASILVGLTKFQLLHLLEAFLLITEQKLSSWAQIKCHFGALGNAQLRGLALNSRKREFRPEVLGAFATGALSFDPINLIFLFPSSHRVLVHYSRKIKAIGPN
jgi:hypothetical protein